MSAAQAAQQHNRTTDGRYTQKLRGETDIDLETGTLPAAAMARLNQARTAERIARRQREDAATAVMMGQVRTEVPQAQILELHHDEQGWKLAGVMTDGGIAIPVPTETLDRLNETGLADLADDAGVDPAAVTWLWADDHTRGTGPLLVVSDDSGDISDQVHPIIIIRDGELALESYYASRKDLDEAVIDMAFERTGQRFADADEAADVLREFEFDDGAEVYL